MTITAAARAKQCQLKKQERQRLDQERVLALYEYERLCLAQGLNLIAGVDEAGRGPLAGPVVAAAVILPFAHYIPKLNDSKKMTPAQREDAFLLIRAQALAVSYAVVSAAQIDAVNIYWAARQAMYQAVAGLAPAAQSVLTDAMPLPELTIPWQAINGGDQVSASIAAASVVAKVERDRIMRTLAVKFPEYGFARHKGYGTAAHKAALVKFGPCPEHRRSFAPVRECLLSAGKNLL